jgi:hypothetical protein
VKRLALVVLLFAALAVIALVYLRTRPSPLPPPPTEARPSSRSAPVSGAAGGASPERAGWATTASAKTLAATILVIATPIRP